MSTLPSSLAAIALCVGLVVACDGAAGRSAARNEMPGAAPPTSVASTPVATQKTEPPGCAGKMNRSGFAPTAAVADLKNRLGTYGAALQLVEEVRSTADEPLPGTLTIHPQDTISNHYVVLCNDAASGEIPETKNRIGRPGWLDEVSKTYPSCAVSAAFGPKATELRFVQGCGIAVHVREVIPALFKEAERKAEAEAARERAASRGQARADLVAQCGIGHVTACEKKGCIPHPPRAEPRCPGGVNPDGPPGRGNGRPPKDDDPPAKAPRPSCGCACGDAALPQPKCSPRM